MIGRLNGKLVLKKVPHLLVDVGGVGYELEAPMTTFYQLPEEGENVLLYTHFLVREDVQLLFGFATETERRLFRNLIKINGVGAKMALAILSGIDTSEFVRSIRQADVATLVKLPGVGKKTAERLIIEMRDRLEDFDVASSSMSVSGATVQTSVSNHVQDAIEALMSLGYKNHEAIRMVKHVSGEDLDSEAIIREALRAAVSR